MTRDGKEVEVSKIWIEHGRPKMMNIEGWLVYA